MAEITTVLTQQAPITTVITYTTGGGGGGVTDHGALTGLGDDDHTQYHNNTRGDARYYLKATVDAAIAVVQSDIDTHEALTNNPHNVTASQVGLGNVDNTSDANKPISTATQTALDGKVDENASIVGATKTKITYDSKGLVTAGADATTADIADSTDKRYVTDAQLTVIGNTSGTNTGDQDLSPYFNKSVDDTDDITEGTNKFATQAEKDKLSNITVTQAVDLDDIETRVNNLDAAVVLKGTWDASSGSFPGGGTAQAGASYIVSVAGTVDGTSFNINDRIIAITDNASTSTFAANWFKADYTDQFLSLDSVTGATTLGAIITGLASKTNPVSPDEFVLSDSAAGNASKKVTLANLKTAIVGGYLLGTNNLSDVSNAATSRTNLGLGTGNSPEFAAVNIGHATDTTVTRTGAGDIAVEGNAIYRAGGTDVPVTDGGTGASTAAAARTNLSTRFVLTFGNATGNPADATTYYVGVPYDGAQTTLVNTRLVEVPRDCVLREWAATIVCNAGSAETFSAWLRINNTTDVLLSNAFGAGTGVTHYSGTGLSTALSATDVAEIKWTSPTWATNPTSLRLYVFLYLE